MAKGFKTGGGSRKGVPNKATADIKALAQEYTEAAIHALAALGGLVEGTASADSDAARVSALNSLLDRGHGKPAQFVEQVVDAYLHDERPQIEAEVDALLAHKPSTANGNGAVH